MGRGKKIPIKSIERYLLLSVLMNLHNRTIAFACQLFYITLQTNCITLGLRCL